MALHFQTKSHRQRGVSPFGHDTKAGIASLCCVLQATPRTSKGPGVDQQNQGQCARAKKLLCCPPCACGAWAHQEHAIQDHTAQSGRVHPPDGIDDPHAVSIVGQGLERWQHQIDAPTADCSSELRQPWTGPSLHHRVQLWNAQRQPGPAGDRGPHGGDAVQVLSKSGKGVGTAGHSNTVERVH